MDRKEDKQIYTPPAPSNEVYSDEELQSIVEGSTWVHLRAMAYELLQQRGVSRAQENWIESYKKERDDAREWAIRLYQDNKRLLSRIGELEVELEETRIALNEMRRFYLASAVLAPNLRVVGDQVFNLTDFDTSEINEDDSNP